MFDEQPDSDPHGECAAEIQRLTGEAAVMRELLRRCIDVFITIEPENDDEAEAMATLRQQIGLAIGDAKGTLL